MASSSQQEPPVRGRPVSLVFDFDKILELLLQGRTKIYLCRTYGIGRTWLSKKLKEQGILPSMLKTAISTETLMNEMKVVLQDYPRAGLRIVTGILRSKGIVATRSRLTDCYRALAPDRIFQNLSRHQHIKRKKYYVPYAHAVWHIDTHLKMKDYGIVFHGGIDGKSRLLVFLEASVSNTSAANLAAFMKGINLYGVPLRVRGDKGGENIDVAAYMLQVRGDNSAAYIAGRSVHNVRIERFWRDLGTQVVSTFKAIFEQLRNEGVLRIFNAVELALLHHVFLPVINERVEEFRNGWNNHSVSTETNKTPIMLAQDYPLPLDKEIPVPEDLEIELSVETRADLNEFTTNVQLFDNSRIPEEARDVLSGLLASHQESPFGEDPVEKYKRLRALL